MTDAEKREAARQFALRWSWRGQEDQDGQTYWLELLQTVLGLDNVFERIDFEKKVVGYDGNVKRIDAYIPETSVLIEQKSYGIDLDKPQYGHGGKTPYEQAKEYADGLPYDEKPRWIIVCNFAEIRIHDMNQKRPDKDPIVILTVELQVKYPMLSFLYKEKVRQISKETEISLQAGELVGKIYDALYEQYNDIINNNEEQQSLNILCTRLVFCLYAEDAGLFGERDRFKEYVGSFEPKGLRRALIDLFTVLNTEGQDRPELYLDDDLESFPYVNGGLFADDIIVPRITDDIKRSILEAADFDWSQISPTIFGAAFESTLNPETRRSGGMHYTSIENIHKVIDPLFLDDLKAEFDRIKTMDPGNRAKQARALQNKIAGLTFLDPACGSGNFLTETYLCLRHLENEIIAILSHDQIQFGFDEANPIKISIENFHGIEINDFAVTVAKTALWIAESQMMDETKKIVYMPISFLPLKTQANIVKGNALQLDWNTMVPEGIDYIMGNPPFIGAALMMPAQKKDIVAIFGKKHKGVGSLDYVSGWYYKAAEIVSNTMTKAALVSTNSVSQGEVCGFMWGKILDMNIRIIFAHRTFNWESEATSKAHVHCVIIGFAGFAIPKKKIIFEGETATEAKNINPYLIDAPDIIISSRSKPICDVPKLTKGNQPTDDGNFILSEDQYAEMVKKDPDSKEYIRQYIGARDFLNKDRVRYCLWLKDVSPSVYRENSEVMRRLQNIRNFRSKSSAAPTRKSADTPYKFFSTPQTDETYLMIPRHSSRSRLYIPIGFMPPSIIASDACSIICGAGLYEFGIMESNVHMAWVRVVAGRIKSDFRYSGGVVYNNFPWPDATEEQRRKIEATAQEILDTRARYPDSSLADLYDPLTMPPDLQKAHTKNDVAVMRAYGFNIKNMSESDCVAALMEMYKKITM